MARKPKRKASFFKVLVGDFANKLRIPPAFVKIFRGNVPSEFTLESDWGSSWRVTVQHEEGRYLFCGTGWSNFVKDHGLEFGDFVVFFLLDSSAFDALIYGPTGCPKKIILAAKRRRGRPVVERQNAETRSREGASGSKKARKSVSRSTVRRARNVGQNIEVVSEAISEHPSVELVLKEYQRCNIAIPRGFAREAGLARELSTVIKDPEDRTWPVSITVSSGQVYLSTGWSKFLRENRIVAGDRLLLQFIPNEGNAAIHVQIVSKAGNGKSKRQNTREKVCEKIILAAQRGRDGPVVTRQHAETPSQEGASSSKKARGVSHGCATVTRARNYGQKIEVVSESKENPSFVLVLKEYQKYGVFVPRSFAKEAGLAQKQKTMIKDPAGNMWQSNIIVGSGQVHLGAGWSKFLQENRIVAGDTLLFQFIPDKGNEIHVQIRRKAGYRNRGRWNKRANIC